MTIIDGLIVVAGCCMGGFVSGVSGFAFGMVAMLSWVWRIEPQLVAPMVVFGSLVTQASSLTATTRKMSWEHFLPLIAGGLAGVPLGIMLLDVIDVHLFKGIVGAVIIIFSAFLMLSPSLCTASMSGRLGDSMAGFVGGVMGGLAGLNGPAPVFWCVVRGWDKDMQRTVTQAFFLVTQAVTLTGYALTGKLTWAVWEIFALMLPVVIIASRIGAKTCERINAETFRWIVLILLLVSGIALVLSTLAGY